MTDEATPREVRTREFRAKNVRRRVAKGTPFGARQARQERAKNGGAFGRESAAMQDRCKGLAR